MLKRMGFWGAEGALSYKQARLVQWDPGRISIGLCSSDHVHLEKGFQEVLLRARRGSGCRTTLNKPRD